jgi:Family of unknown function (DUF5995)
MPLHNIDEVITKLDEVIARARSEESRQGFFAVLYRNVTLKVKAGIDAGFFEDGPRMERLDVAFANRYLSALESFRRGERPSRCWLVSFEAAATWSPLIIQHLLLGTNAHVNFDLGVAAAETCPGDQLPGLKTDFDRINMVLGGMLVKVKENIDQLSPWIKLINHVAPATEDRIINFSLDKARASAWLVANMLATLSPAEQTRKLEILDNAVAAFGNLLRSPKGLLVNLALSAIRLRESNDIPRIIDVLSQT